EKPRDKSKLFCSFCRKSAKEIPSLVAGPGVHICGDCVAICNSILEGLPADGFAGWDKLEDDKLLANLERSQAAFEGARAVLQQQIDTLRGREVSWQKIGEALGVSRQAAWERFG
ncbi:MAG TPA: ClpX C4-type zinc finger protein, partial [Hyphomonadaceae bacterium]|nr:ClpX C4-type zinc finger protein [Hyphomonadaceae bacterium]